MKEKIKDLLKTSRTLAKEKPFESYDMAKQALDLAKKLDLKLEIADSYFNLSYACRVMSDYVNGLDFALNALQLYEDENNTLGIIKVKNMIGIIYFYYGDYSSALEHYTSASELFGSTSDANLETSISNNIGEIYREAKQGDLALTYYNKALVVSLKAKLDYNASILYLNIGEILYSKGDYTRAKESIMKSQKIASESNDALALAEAESQLGRLKVVDLDYSSAVDYYKSALSRLSQVHNRFYTIDILIKFSELDVLMNESPIVHLTEALNQATEIGLDSKVSVIYGCLSAYYESIGDFETALTYWKSYHIKEKELDLSNLSKKLEVLSLELKYYKEQSYADKILKASQKFEREANEAKEELERSKVENLKLLEVSVIDELTQIYNRRGITRLLEEKYSTCVECFNFVMIIDIDFFKRFNDNWGHVKGDECLKEISNYLKGLTFEDYFVGRYGGEEFLCYAKVKSLDQARQIAETICDGVRKLSLPYDQTPQSKVITISLGGVINDSTYSSKQCIEIADKNLYHIKETGRDRAEITT